jgi:GTPase
VLAEIGAADIPQLLVYNKVDQLPDSQRPRVSLDWIERSPGQRVPRIWVSALDGTGLDILRDGIARFAADTLPDAGPPSHLPDESPAPPDDDDRPPTFHA